MKKEKRLGPLDQKFKGWEGIKRELSYNREHALDYNRPIDPPRKDSKKERVSA